MGRRFPPALVALAVASLTAAGGAWKRWHAVPRALDAPVAPSPARADTAAPAGSFAPRVPAQVDPALSFRGDRTRRHRSAFGGPVTKPEASFVWDAGGPVEAMPAISREGDIVVASLSGRVARLTPDGVAAWTVEIGDRVYASPLLLGDAVVLGSDAKRVMSLALATGKKRWELDVDGEADTAAATTPDGALVVAAGRVLYGLRADGAVRFRLRLPRKIYASPAVADDGTIYVGAQDHRLYAVSSRGAVLWSHDLGGDVDCAAAIGDDGTVYAGSDAGQVVALDPEGHERWSAAVGGFVRGGLTVSRSGVVLAGTYGPAPRVVALDGATGREAWSFPVQGTGVPEFGIHGAPLEDPEGNLYFGAQDDQIYALDPAGRLRWAFATHGDVDAPLVIGPGGALYAGSDDGHLYSLH